MSVETEKKASNEKNVPMEEGRGRVQGQDQESKGIWEREKHGRGKTS